MGLGHAHDRAHCAQHLLGQIEVRFVGPRSGGDRRRAFADERARIGHGAHHRPVAGPGFDVGERHSRRDREDERVVGEDRGARFERGSDVARLDRDDDDIGVGRRPGGARDHTHSREPLLEHPPALAVDLRDRDGVAVPAGVDQALRERLAHSTAAQEGKIHLLRLNRCSQVVGVNA